jgi:hypothetical protein
MKGRKYLDFEEMKNSATRSPSPSMRAMLNWAVEVLRDNITARFFSSMQSPAALGGEKGREKGCLQRPKS